jgi:hypothetical protein
MNSLKDGTMWHVDPLPGSYSETNEKTAIVKQQLRKYAAELKSLLGSAPHATMEVLSEAVFPMWFAPRRYYSTDRVQFS